MKGVKMKTATGGWELKKEGEIETMCRLQVHDLYKVYWKNCQIDSIPVRTPNSQL